jgi:holo-[acyl-carrier protein] synthase
MTLRSGVDIVEIQRFEDLTPAIFMRFVERVFTPQELNEAGNSMQYLAGRFAAKEAVAKALGCGIGLIGWKDVEILTGEKGEPKLSLRGRALEESANLGVREWSLSISHSHQYAVAMVIGMG